MKAQLLLEKGTYIDTVIIKSVPTKGDTISYITFAGMRTRYKVVNICYEFRCKGEPYPEALIILSLREESESE